MTRSGKQIIYGSVYALILLGFAAWIFLSVSDTEPSCTNGRRDEGEKGVDCGGVCRNICLPSDLRALRTSGEPKIFQPAPGRVSVLYELENPNQEFAARSFAYKLELADASGEVLASRSGSSYLYAGERRWVAEFLDLAAAASAKVTLSNPDWVPKASFPAAALAIQDRIFEKTTAELKVSGRVGNRDSSDFASVTLLAIFRNGSGVPVGVSKTELGDLRVGESSPFTVFHPVVRSVDLNRTEIYPSAKRP